MSADRLVVVGDALLDRDLDGRVERLAPDAPVPVVDDPEQRTRPGGAGLAAALLAAEGRQVTLVTALATDLAGRELAAALAEAGVEVIDLGLDGATPEKVRIRAQGRPLLRLDRGGRDGGTIGSAGPDVRRAVSSGSAVLVSDYGRGVAAEPGVRAAIAGAPVPVVWDPHPRGAEPVAGAVLVTPNASEAERLAPEGRDHGDRARRLAARWRAGAVCVTLGAAGAVVAGRGKAPLLVPAPPVAGGDPCGAGDRFASAAASLLAVGAGTEEAVTGAVESASAFVAAGGAGEARLGHPEPLDPRRPAAASLPPRRAEAVVSRVRAAGGTVVATGGCFDLLHAGHVSVLEAARALGDCLVVCLNSDDSVRRLKGPDRPLNDAHERAAVLEALACVDAVAIFDEDTPEAVLDRLRPDIWAKGGDYEASELPESASLRRRGARTVILPYVEGRSTTRLIREVEARGR